MNVGTLVRQQQKIRSSANGLSDNDEIGELLPFIVVTRSGCFLFRWLCIQHLLDFIKSQNDFVIVRIKFVHELNKMIDPARLLRTAIPSMKFIVNLLSSVSLTLFGLKRLSRKSYGEIAGFCFKRYCSGFAAMLAPRQAGRKRFVGK